MIASKVLSAEHSQLASYQLKFIGLREKEREWPMRSHSSYDGYFPIQRNVAGSLLRLPLLASLATTAGCSQTGYLVRLLSRLVPLPHVSYSSTVHHSFVPPSAYLSLTLNLKP
jgi:hypothetical protein